MSYLREKVAFLKGLAEGMQINESTNEGKLLKAMIDVMDDFALTLEDIEEIQEEMSEQVDNIDEDLAEVERLIFDEDECDYDDVFVGEIECPYCNEKISVDEDTLDEEGVFFECPNCHKKIEIEWDCDCDCDCEEHNKED